MFAAVSGSLTALCRFSFILGSYDKDDGAQLYMVDPSGISYVSLSELQQGGSAADSTTNHAVCVCVFVQGYWGCAIGKAKQAAKTEIEKLQVRRLYSRQKQKLKLLNIIRKFNAI